MSDLAIDLDNVSRRYESTGFGLRSVTLKVNRGEFLYLVGKSGSGKSTLLNIIGLLDSPDDGIYRLFGKQVTGLSQRDLARERARHLGFVFQSFNLQPRRFVWQNVALGGLYAGISRSDRRERAFAVLERLDLLDRAWARASELSGGERQRVAIARALVKTPALLLCDEPTGNLDNSNGRSVIDLLEAEHAEGTTVVVVTHDVEFAARGTRTVSVHDGLIRNVSGLQSG